MDMGFYTHFTVQRQEAERNAVALCGLSGMCLQHMQSPPFQENFAVGYLHGEQNHEIL